MEERQMKMHGLGGRSRKMKFKQWFRKWLMFAVALLIGNKIYGSKYDDGMSWRTELH